MTDMPSKTPDRPASAPARASSPPASLHNRQIAPTSSTAALPIPAEQLERRVFAFMGATRRAGRWLVPRVMRVRVALGEVVIDLRENPIPPDFLCDVKAFGAKVLIIVPPGVAVVFDVFALMGNAFNRADEPVAGETRRPAIRVQGSVVMGEVSVVVREPERGP